MIAPFDSVVVRTVVRLMVPFMQVFALYVLFHGHESPGGGFQGGAILGASVVLLRFTQPERFGTRILPSPWAIRFGAVGVLIYGLVGFVPMLRGGAFLDYGRLPLPGLAAPTVRAAGILGVEIGVALAVMGVMVAIFDALAPGAESRAARPEAS